jgi:hypothetical protein
MCNCNSNCYCGGTCNNCQKTSTDNITYTGPNLPITGIMFSDTMTTALQRIEVVVNASAGQAIKTYNWAGDGDSQVGEVYNNTGAGGKMLVLNNTGAGGGVLTAINSGSGDGPFFINTATVGISSAAAYFENNGGGNSKAIQYTNNSSGAGLTGYSSVTATGPLFALFNDGTSSVNISQIVSEAGSGTLLALTSMDPHTGWVFSVQNNLTNKLVIDRNGTVTASKYALMALNTAPVSAAATGTLGEIRIDASFIYVCVATNTWKRAALTTW